MSNEAPVSFFARQRQSIQFYLPLFSASMLGLVFIHIWTQTNLYGTYNATDAGTITIQSNLFRCIVIAIMIAIAIWRGSNPQTRERFGYISAAALTLSTALLLIDCSAPTTEASMIAVLLGGFGLAWCAAMWMTQFVRLCAAEAFFYTCLSFSLSCIAGFILGILPLYITYLTATVMPALSLISFLKTRKMLDAREANSTFLVAYPDFLPYESIEKVYGKPQANTLIRILLGIVVFNFVIGVARGFPFGESISLTVSLQAFHQLGAAAIFAFIAWWVLIARKNIRFTVLCYVPFFLVACGIMCIAGGAEPFLEWGGVLVTLANTLGIGLLWYSAYDFARHSTMRSYLVLGVLWIAHILPRELGRLLILYFPLEPSQTVIAALVLMVLIAASMVLLLGSETMKPRPLFAEFRNQDTNYIEHALRVACQQGLAPSEETPTPDALATNNRETQVARVKETFQLTEREAEILLELAYGRSKIAIADKLFISENTVRTHVKKIYTKLDIHNKQELIDLIDGQA